MNQTNFTPFLTRYNSSGSTSDKEQVIDSSKPSTRAWNEPLDLLTFVTMQSYLCSIGGKV